MAAYIQARDNLASVYLLTGISKQNDILVKLANSDQLSLAQKSFSFPPKCVVYSIQRRQCKDSLSLACYDLLHNISTDQLKRLTSIPWESSSDPLPCRENQETAQKTPEHVDSPVLPSLATSGSNKKIKTSDFKNFFSKIEKSVQDDKTLENYLATSTKNNMIPKPVESGKLDVSDEDEEFGLKTTYSSQKRKCIVIESDEEKEESSTVTKDCVSTNLFNSKASTKLRNNDIQKKRPTRRK
ncbi:DNA polymerase delta subunit 3, partial [Schistosoma bovis]